MLRSRLNLLMGVWLLTLAVVATAPVAHASKQRRATVLPVETIGRMRNLPRWQTEFQGQLEEELRNAGFVLPSERSTQACRDPDGEPDTKCMAQVARALQCDLVVGARVVNDGHVPPNFLVRVWVFDLEKPNERRVVERTHPNGTEADAAQALAKQLGEALSPPKFIEQPPDRHKPDRTKVENPTLIEPKRLEPTFIERAPFGMTRKQRWIVRGFAIGFGVLGLAGMIDGGVHVRLDDQPVGPNGETDCAPNCGYHRDTSRGQIVYFSLGGAALLGGAILAGIGWWPSKKVQVAPEASPTSGKLSLRVRF